MNSELTDSMKFLRNANNPLLFFSFIGYFYFDKLKLFMIESESLLRQQFCFGGALFKKIVATKKSY